MVSLRELIDKYFRFHEVPALRLTWRRSQLGYGKKLSLGKSGESGEAREAQKIILSILVRFSSILRETRWFCGPISSTAKRFSKLTSDQVPLAIISKTSVTDGPKRFNIVNMSNILGKNVDSIKIQRNLN